MTGHVARSQPLVERPFAHSLWSQMSFTVYGEHPGSGGLLEFDRQTAAGAVFKAADLMSNGGRAFTFQMKRASSIGLIGSISS